MTNMESPETSGCPTERKCKKCQRTMPIQAFTRNKKCKWGYEHRCRACAITTTKKWARENPSQAQKIKDDWRENNPEKHQQAVRDSNRRHRDKRKAYQEAYEKNNKNKIHARAAVHRAIETGRLIRPERCDRCSSTCGAGGRIEAHHRDYRMPLEVDWLCSICHNGITRSGG